MMCMHARSTGMLYTFKAFYVCGNCMHANLLLLVDVVVNLEGVIACARFCHATAGGGGIKTWHPIREVNPPLIISSIRIEDRNEMWKKYILFFPWKDCGEEEEGGRWIWKGEKGGCSCNVEGTPTSSFAVGLCCQGYSQVSRHISTSLYV